MLSFDKQMFSNFNLLCFIIFLLLLLLLFVSNLRTVLLSETHKDSFKLCFTFSVWIYSTYPGHFCLLGVAVALLFHGVLELP